MKVVFRVDASDSIGTGHHYRCMTLAQSLRQRGAEVRFLCRAHQGHLIGLLQQEGLPATALPAPLASRSRSGAGVSGWLGATQAEDAAQTIAALGGEAPDWVVVDHYGLDAEWERHLRPHAGRLMVIDDLANRPHDCDVLLDQNFSLEGARRYAALVPPSCALLIGPRYALLHAAYAERRRTLRPRDGSVGSVLVFFGGSDRGNMTAGALAALSAPGLRHLEAVVVVGANNAHRTVLEQQCARRPNTRLLGPRPHLADLMAEADLAIGAGGATAWERMALGLPSIVASIADNQRPACEALAAGRLIDYAGEARHVTPDRLRRLVEEAIADPAWLVEQGSLSRLQVDALGVPRVAEALLPSDPSELQLRAVRPDDIDLYHAWANDPDVRSNAINPDPITWPTHREWFARRLRDPASRLFVLEARGLPLGQIRFDLEPGQARISYSLDPIARGRGWGARLVTLGMRRLPDRPRRFWADVKATNAPSCAVFLRTGFREVASPLPAGFRSFCLDAAEREPATGLVGGDRQQGAKP